MAVTVMFSSGICIEYFGFTYTPKFSKVSREIQTISSKTFHIKRNVVMWSCSSLTVKSCENYEVTRFAGFKYISTSLVKKKLC